MFYPSHCITYESYFHLSWNCEVQTVCGVVREGIITVTWNSRQKNLVGPWKMGRLGIDIGTAQGTFFIQYLRQDPVKLASLKKILIKNYIVSSRANRDEEPLSFLMGRTKKLLGRKQLCLSPIFCSFHSCSHWHRLVLVCFHVPATLLSLFNN